MKIVKEALNFPNTSIKSAVEALLAHFFSHHRPGYHKEDVTWFLDWANTQKYWCASTSHDTLEMGILKFYLGSVLRICKVPSHSAHVASNSLPNYHQQFRSLVGEVLMQGENLGPAAPYIPLFYQKELSANVCILLLILNLAVLPVYCRITECSSLSVTSTL